MKKVENYPSWLVPVGMAKSLKKAGFDLPCEFFLPLDIYEDFNTDELSFDYNRYNHNSEIGYLSIPTYEQVFEWFASRGWLGVILHLGTSDYSYRVQNRDMLILPVEDEVFSSYTEARESLIYEMIELYEGQNVLIPIEF